MTREKPGLGPSPHARRDHSTAETGGRPILLPAVPSIWKRPVGEEGSRRPRHSSQWLPRAPRIHSSIVHQFVQLI